MITDIIKKLRNKTLSLFDMNKVGGEWLGVARSWIQWNFVNGSDVTWGSDDQLLSSKTLTVSEIEALAARIALATLEEYSSYLVTEGERAALGAYLNKQNWASYIKEENNGNLIVFQPNRNSLHFLAAYAHKHGWDIAEKIDGSNADETSK